MSKGREMAHRQPLVPSAPPGRHDHTVKCLTQLFHLYPAVQTRAKRGYAVSTKEDGVLIAKNLKVQTEQKQLIYLPADIFISAKYKY